MCLLTRVAVSTGKDLLGDCQLRGPGVSWGTSGRQVLKDHTLPCPPFAEGAWARTLIHHWGQTLQGALWLSTLVVSEWVERHLSSCSLLCVWAGLAHT